MVLTIHNHIIYPQAVRRCVGFLEREGRRGTEGKGEREGRRIRNSGFVLIAIQQMQLRSLTM